MADRAAPKLSWPGRSTSLTAADTPAPTEDILALLRAHEAELREAGVRPLPQFGSVAREDFAPESDVDLAVEFNPACRMGLFRLTALERRRSEIVDRRVDLEPEPVEKPRLRANIGRDRRVAFPT